jgi:hypothetical protein
LSGHCCLGILIGILTGKEDNSRWKEEMVMKLTILIIITALGVLIPLLWITGTLTSIVYFIRHRENITRKEGAFTLSPQLGLTMADGGDSVDGADGTHRCIGAANCHPLSGWRFGSWPSRGSSADKEIKE